MATIHMEYVGQQFFCSAREVKFLHFNAFAKMNVFIIFKINTLIIIFVNCFKRLHPATFK